MLRSLSRGEAIYKYLEIIQSLPMYSMHYFEVKVRQLTLSFLDLTLYFNSLLLKQLAICFLFCRIRKTHPSGWGWGLTGYASVLTTIGMSRNV